MIMGLCGNTSQMTFRVGDLLGRNVKDGQRGEEYTTKYKN